MHGANETLSDYIKGELPFLFKVLSIRTALSVQAHPNKTLATQLHKENPSMYKDPNHKPELALAISPFEAMCGFRPLSEIAENLQSTPELQNLVGQEVSSQFIASPSKQLLKEVFTNLMTATAEAVSEQIRALVGRLQPEPLLSESRAIAPAELILRLHQQYGDDVGLFAPLLLNCFKLKVGECIFLTPDEPHAYIAGDCVECMACSDNVVRAGLTPKPRDTRTLCSMLTYEAGPVAVMGGVRFDEHTTRYGPPEEEGKRFPEFRLSQISLPADEEYELPALPSHSLLLVYRGEGFLETHALAKGFVFFVPKDSRRRVTAGPSGALLFQCFSSDT